MRIAMCLYVTVVFAVLLAVMMYDYVENVTTVVMIVICVKVITGCLVGLNG